MKPRRLATLGFPYWKQLQFRIFTAETRRTQRPERRGLTGGTGSRPTAATLYLCRLFMNWRLSSAVAVARCTRPRCPLRRYANRRFLCVFLCDLGVLCGDLQANGGSERLRLTRPPTAGSTRGRCMAANARIESPNRVKIKLCRHTPADSPPSTYESPRTHAHDHTLR